MQSSGKHGRLSRGIVISKVQTFSCGIFGAVCGPFLLSPRNPHYVRKNNQEFSASNILLIQGQSSDDSSEVFQAASSGAETPNFFSLNIITCTSGDSSAPGSPVQPIPGRGRVFTDIELTRASLSQDFSDEQCIENLLTKIRKGSCTRSGLDTLLRLVGESKHGNIRALEEHVASALISLLTSSQLDDCFKHTEPYQEAFVAIVRLVHNEAILKRSANPEMLRVLDWMLHRGSLNARVNAAVLLQKISSNEGLEKAVTDRQSILDGVVSLMLKREQPNAIKLASRALLALCLSVENRSGAVRAGSVAAIMKILPSATIKTAEKALAILELLATAPEGRVAMSEHELVVPVLVNMILKISDRATEYAAGALCAICTSETHQVQERAVQAGAQTRLLLLLQSQCTSRAKRKALLLLKVLHRFWDQEPHIAESGRTDRIHY